MKKTQTMKCSTCGEDFEFGIDNGIPLNCDTHAMLNRLEIYCPHCGEEYYSYGSGTGIVKKSERGW